jgi:transcriptional regulator with XRE-family HTH domain
MNSPSLPPYKALRDLIGMTQRAVERELGWNTGRLSTIERGLIPTEDERRQLMAFLNERIQAETKEATS